MVLVSADKILMRCSSLGKIMPDGNKITDIQLAKIDEYKAKPKLTPKQAEDLAKYIHKRDNPELSATCKSKLLELWIEQTLGRRKEIKSKYLDKGNFREEDSLTLLSILVGIILNKNTIRLSNDYITGEPDTYMGDSIYNADVTLDTKSSWSANTFFEAKHGEIDSDYWWQGQGYMWLTGAKKHLICYCLVNGIDKAINDEKKALAFKMGIIDDAMINEEYIEKCKKIEINHIFDIKAFIKDYPYFVFHNDTDNWEWDIPAKDRLFVFEVERDEVAIKKIKDRVIECREYMNETFFMVKKNLA
jgi:hypothetical protein